MTRRWPPENEATWPGAHAAGWCSCVATRENNVRMGEHTRSPYGSYHHFTFDSYVVLQLRAREDRKTQVYYTAARSAYGQGLDASTYNRSP